MGTGTRKGPSDSLCTETDAVGCRWLLRGFASWENREKEVKEGNKYVTPSHTNNFNLIIEEQKLRNKKTGKIEVAETEGAYFMYIWNEDGYTKL